MKVPLVDLKRQYESIKDDIDDAIHSVIDSGCFVHGENIEKFEEEFAQFCQTKYCLAVGSGTDALRLTVRAVSSYGGYGLVPANGFVAVADALHHNSMLVGFSDIDPEYYTMHPQSGVWECIIPVHLYGQPADMDALREKVVTSPIIEDCAQAHGAMYKGKRVGSIGEAGCFSFYPSKGLGAYGHAGAVVTNNEEIYRKVRLMRNFGWVNREDHILIGSNSNMDELQAAILRVKLPHLPKWNNRRRSNAHTYNDLLSSVFQVNTPPEKTGWSLPVFQLYVIRCEARDELRIFLEKKGIETGVHYPVPIHLTKAYEWLGYKRGSFPVAEEYAGKVLSLPMFPEVEEEEIHYVVDCIKEYYGD